MKVHLLGVCGMGMGSLAGLLQQAGHQVSGCDRALEPPMADRLVEWGIKTHLGFDPAHLDERPDLVVVGNICRADNPEAVEARRRGLAVKSFPQTLEEMFISERHSIVVAGTHGKTTTTALLGWALESLGAEPGYLYGGILNSSGRGFSLGKGKFFVVEGDEYDSAFFDKHAKFLHYRPRTLILASLEYDHADIYPDQESYLDAFRKLVALLPENGLLVACRDYPAARSLAAGCRAPTVFYGLSPGAGWQAVGIEHSPTGVAFLASRDGSPQARVRLPLAGAHNAANALAVLAALSELDLSVQDGADALARFPGLKRRLEERGRAAGVIVLDDFAHHPTKVRVTVEAVRRRYPKAHLVAVFEPRSNTSRRKVFQRSYPASFADADEVILVPPYRAEQIAPEERFDSDLMVRELTREGKRARLFPYAQAVADALGEELKPGSVVLVMSNGSFDGLPAKLLDKLSRRGGKEA